LFGWTLLRWGTPGWRTQPCQSPFSQIFGNWLWVVVVYLLIGYFFLVVSLFVFEYFCYRLSQSSLFHLFDLGIINNNTLQFVFSLVRALGYRLCPLTVFTVDGKCWWVVPWFCHVLDEWFNKRSDGGVNKLLVTSLLIFMVLAWWATLFSNVLQLFV
jgi:hypothetical protein